MNVVELPTTYCSSLLPNTGKTIMLEGIITIIIKYTKTP